MSLHGRFISSHLLREDFLPITTRVSQFEFSHRYAHARTREMFEKVLLGVLQQMQEVRPRVF